jgi:outer membrane protein assembly factor BamB
MKPCLPLFRVTPFWLSLTALVLLAGPARSLDWPSWRGPNHDGHSKETEFHWAWNQRAPKVLWRATIGYGYSSVAVSTGKVFTMGNVNGTDQVLAFDVATGRQAWRYTYPCMAVDLDRYPGPRCTPTVAGDQVYTVSRLGHLLCINFDTGQLRWSRDIRNDYKGLLPIWGYCGSPLVQGNLLIVETGNLKGRSVVALNRLNGNLVWANGTDRTGYSSPVPFMVGDQQGVAVFSGQSITGRLLSNGTPIWRQKWKTTDDVQPASPIIFEDKVFVSSGYNSGCSLFRFGNNFSQTIWSNRYMRNRQSSSVLVNSHIYGFDENELRCMDIVNGAIKWRSRNYGVGSLMAAGDKLIVQAEDGQVAVVQASPWQYKELGRMKAFNDKQCWTQPVVANKTLYVRNKGNLIAYDVRP